LGERGDKVTKRYLFTEKRGSAPKKHTFIFGASSKSHAVEDEGDHTKDEVHHRYWHALSAEGINTELSNCFHSSDLVVI
jgi:hypothetical protein